MSDKKYQYTRAIALQYEDSETEAPTVTVKGETYSADEVVKIARRYGIPVVENPSLAKALQNTELDSEIPEELFQAVATLLNNIDASLSKKK